ncbi:MAG: hypothetical protein JZU50_14330 [Desulfobulbaceae bacterium]|nr:hypothetical protein [Desulfobulbaceae bacterium]
MNTFLLPQLTLALPAEAVLGFASLLQHGMLVGVDRPVAVLPLLLTLPGFTAEYIEKTVQTIFINGVAADSFDQLLPAGSTLALSAAMPGLAGAIFRRQGLHGTLRSQPEAKVAIPQSASGFITLKLFNSIATDRIRDLLPHGICCTGKRFHDFAAQREYLFQPPVAVSFADQPLEFAELLQTVAKCPLLLVTANLFGNQIDPGRSLPCFQG